MADSVKVTLPTGSVIHTSPAAAERLKAMAERSKPKAKAKPKPAEPDTEE